MSGGGLRILHVHPRLAGKLESWSGLNSADGRSWLIDHAKSMKFNTIWFSPLSVPSDVPVMRHGRTVSGCLYAARNHFAVNQELSTGNKSTDDTHLRAFTAQAARAGITVMADLVLNHVARDHELVSNEDSAIEEIKKSARNIRPLHRNGSLIGMEYDRDGAPSQTFHFKFVRNTDFSLALTGVDSDSGPEIWDDVAKINYNSPAAMNYFVHGEQGKPGYWKQVMDWHLDRGFTGFRCDVAYMIPAAVWSELGQHAHNRKPGVCFMAETLGDKGKANELAKAEITADGQKRKLFDLAMLGTYWWNYRDDWMIHENERMKEISRFGGAGSPDTHDTHDTVAGGLSRQFKEKAEPERSRIVGDACLRDYAVAALICNSVYMQMGYEYCRDQVSVFREPHLNDYWNNLRRERGHPRHPLNLTTEIAAINDFKEKLNHANTVVRMDKISECGPNNRLLKIECTMLSNSTRRDTGKMVLYINEKPENGPVTLTREMFNRNSAGHEMQRLAIDHFDREGKSEFVIRDVAAFYTPLPETPEQVPVLPAPVHHKVPHPVLANL